MNDRGDRELSRLSPYNEPTARGDAVGAVARRISINDCTLREGEQSSEAAFSPEEKRTVVRLLDEIGVGCVQIGFPPEDEDERAELRSLIRSLRRADTEVMVVAFAPNWKEQLEWAAEMEPSVIHIIYRSSPHLLRLLGSSVDELLRRTEESIRYIRGLGARHVTFCPTDTTRTIWETLRQAFAAAKDAGADTLCIADTVGVATPAAVAWLVRSVRAAFGLPVEVHCHNDFGLALANALAGVEAGASVVDTCVNGLGDRNGNPSLDEVVVAAELLYHAEAGVQLSRLSEVSRIVAGLTGIPVHANKPIVGANAFSQKLDIHVRAAVQDPLAFQPYLPEVVGNRTRLVMGKQTGPYAVRAKLQSLDVPEPGEEVVSRLVAAVNGFAVEHKRSMSDEELLGILQASS